MKQYKKLLMEGSVQGWSGQFWARPAACRHLPARATTKILTVFYPKPEPPPMLTAAQIIFNARDIISNILQLHLATS